MQSKELKKNLLRECPFCGGEAEKWSCDRLITISCKKCNYTRNFNGLVSNKKTDVPVVYEGGIVSDSEFYNRYAHEEAIEAWNNRAIESEIRAKVYDKVCNAISNLLSGDTKHLEGGAYYKELAYIEVLRMVDQLKEE